MLEMDNLDSPQLVEAVQLYAGWGESKMPSRDDRRVVDRFDGEVAAKLLSVVKSLENDFYSSDARLVAANLQEMEKRASDQFKRRHFSVADEIVKAFAWCYAFDFK